MRREDVLAEPATVLSQEQRESYFENGYILLERVVSDEWLERLRAVTAEFVEQSRAMTQSDAVFDLEPDHTADTPRLRRLSSPIEQHPTYWEFASRSLLVDIAADLVGPDVKFHHSKLNFKWSKGGEEVEVAPGHPVLAAHQLQPAAPSALYMDDCDEEQGPLGVVPGSHERELYSLYDEGAQWTGSLSEADARAAGADEAVYLTGPAGSVTVHNCRTVHGSRRNMSDLGRPLLLNVYSAADAFTYTANPLPSKYAGAIIRGEPARWAHHDPRGCLVPPDWSGGYTSIFALQQGEERLEQAAGQHAGTTGKPTAPGS